MESFTKLSCFSRITAAARLCAACIPPLFPPFHPPLFPVKTEVNGSAPPAYLSLRYCIYAYIRSYFILKKRVCVGVLLFSNIFMWVSFKTCRLWLKPVNSHGCFTNYISVQNTDFGRSVHDLSLINNQYRIRHFEVWQCLFSLY